MARTPAALAGLLDGVGPGWQAANEGPETWSPVDVLGHLIHGEETDWVPRARIILERYAVDVGPWEKYHSILRDRR